ncbi:MAG: hypothetical protein A2X36_07410 [Elusimicrobia bacterium GWA2_69_24]|nr:MAG: hypothetical protein A2X36_07410 [Elusimicrobia bacterium GWA2_69_24]HBL18993.1 hypothetical protein [Elusimicrobiota bacterium]
MSREKFIWTVIGALGIMALSLLGAYVATDVYWKKHPVNFRNLPWDIDAAALRAQRGDFPLRETPSGLEEAHSFGDYDGIIRYDFSGDKLRGISIDTLRDRRSGAEPSIRACDYFLYTLTRRFDAPTASGGDPSLDFAARAGQVQPRAPERGADFWAAWYTTTSAAKLECRVPPGSQKAQVRMSFLPLSGMDTRAQREF